MTNEELSPDGGIRVMTLNVAHGSRAPVPAVVHRAVTIRRNLDAVARTVERARVDVVALQEVDRASFWSGRIDHFDHIAEESRRCHRIHGGHVEHAGLGLRHGTAILSREPLLATRSLAFRTARVDDKGYVMATIAFPGQPNRQIDVISVHLDPISEAKRRRQVALMAEDLRTEMRPRIVMGDMNAGWRRGDRVVGELARALGLRAYEPEGHHPTYPAFRPTWRLDWILASPELTFTSYETLEDRVSDHCAVVATVALS